MNDYIRLNRHTYFNYKFFLVAFLLLWKSLFAQEDTFIKRYGGEWKNGAYDIKETLDKCYIVTGYADRKTIISATGSKSYSKIYLMKIDRNGQPIWSKTYAPQNYQLGLNVFPNSDGGFSICGQITDSVTKWVDIFILRTNGKGDQLSFKKIELNIISTFSIMQKNDTLILVTLPLIINGNFSFPVLTKMDPSGNILSQSEIKAEVYSIYALAVTSDNGFIMSGSSAFLLKTDSLGSVTWKKDKLYTDSTKYQPSIESIIQDNGGGFFCVGEKPVIIGGEISHNMLFIRTDKDGNTLWKTVSADGYSWAKNCIQTSDGNYMVCGVRNSHPVLAKLDTTGTIKWIKQYGTKDILQRHTLNSLIVTSENKIVACGVDGKSDNMDISELLLVKTDNSGEVTKVGNNDILKVSGYILMQNYPNPFNPSTTISHSIPKESYVELKVYDILGREVSTLVSKVQSAGEYNVQFDGSSLPSGVYIYTIQAGSFRDSKKLILLK